MRPCSVCGLVPSVQMEDVNYWLCHECIRERVSENIDLRRIASKLAGVRDAAQRLQEYIRGGVKSIDMLVAYAEATENAIADLSPEAREFGEVK